MIGYGVIGISLFNYTVVYSPLSPIEGLLVKGQSGAPLRGLFFEFFSP